MGKGNKVARPTKRDFAKAETLNDAILTAIAGPYNRDVFWDAFFHFYAPGDDRRRARISEAMVKALESGDASFFEQMEKFLRWLKGRKPGDCYPDPDAAAVLYGTLQGRAERKDPSWRPSNKEILAMLPDPDGKGRDLKQVERVKEKLAHVL